jgi:phospholipase D1/2
MQTPTLVTPATMTDEEATSAETGKTLRHKNIIHGAPPSVGDRTLDEERKDFNEKGQKIMGFAAVIRTLEEQAIIEKTPLKDQTDNGKHEATLKDQTIIEESESGSVQSGPVNGSGPHEPSTVDSVLLGASDVNSEERATASARATTRANIGSRSGRKPWTVPTMKPKVEPQDFEDPISDAFWKNIWIASAVHNVSAFLLLAFYYT